MESRVYGPWRFKSDAKPQGSSSGFWYDLNNGYIVPGDVLADEGQIEEVKRALGVLSSFDAALEEAELIYE